MKDRLLETWRRALSLSWPIMAEQSFSTLMRTTDIIITGLFSPAAIVAVGLADRYATIPLRIGLGLGSGAIVLSSQNTAGGMKASRDEAVTQAVLLAALLGVPFMLIGVFFGEILIAILGASTEVIELAGTYLAIIFLASPARHVGLTAAKAIQGTGDTKTPMYVNIGANVLNISSTVVLGLGVGPVPAFGVIGVGIATAVSRTVRASSLVLIIFSRRSVLSFTRPRDPTIARQLVQLAIPRTAEGIGKSAADFPFNAILLMIGTEFNAAYQIGRRVYQQLSSPLSRAYRTTASIVVGQDLGEKNVNDASFNGKAIALLGVLTIGLVSIILVVGADRVVQIFTQDQLTKQYGVRFIQIYAIGALFFVVFRVFSGALEGGSDTRTPFVANVSGAFVLLVGVSYIAGIYFGYGPMGIYAAVLLNHIWLALFVGVLFYWGSWADRAIHMMDERRRASGVDQEKSN